MEIPKYSMGIGDRFGRQGRAQLSAMVEARMAGAPVCPVWNKSHREHSIIHTRPEDVRREADAAVAAAGWDAPYFVDADHINLDTVDGFIDSSDFFTLDVAGAIGTAAGADAIEAFAGRHAGLCGTLQIDGIDEPLRISPGRVRSVAGEYLFAVQQAGRIYRRIAGRKGAGSFVTEISMDETPTPQQPEELLFILAAIADEGIPAQTIAPRFSGRFNKGVDYFGDVTDFEREFRADLAVIRYAVESFGLPGNLKLSVHSGSDKFSIYPCMARAIAEFDAGLHLKTAGTTWLEEIIGLAESGADGLAIAREVYGRALERREELCGPYADVIDIDPARLPDLSQVETWSGKQFAGVLRHDPGCAAYNADFRQLLHVGYKVAAEMGDRYLEALDRNAANVSHHVRQNLVERHIKPLFCS